MHFKQLRDFQLIILYYILCLCLTQLIKCEDNLELKCLESSSHKAKPSSEDYLHGQCKTWNSLSCCSTNTTETFHLIENWQGFNYNHCGRLSNSCKNYFLKELCLYECDPYLGNWIVKDSSKKIRKERYYHVPMCYSDCQNWFDACKDDYTCRDNWNRGFKWINGTNYCYDHEKCETFSSKFKTAQNFCSKIWDESFEVQAENSSMCISFEFDENELNPNKRVALFYQTNNADLFKCGKLKLLPYFLALITLII